MVVHFNRLKLYPTNVCSSSYCPQDASYSGQLDGAASSPVGIETCSLGGQVLLILDDDDDDDDERFADSSVLAAESSSTTDDGDTSPTKTTESTCLLGLPRVHQLLRLHQLLRKHQLQIKCHLGCSPQRLDT